jgi:hypothetical protein
MARVRRAAVVSFLVALALVLSAWLAYATTAPGHADYGNPNPTSHVAGGGGCLFIPHSGFGFDIQHDGDGNLLGAARFDLGFLPWRFFGEQPTRLSVDGNQAWFRINGAVTGPLIHGEHAASANVAMIDGNPDRMSVTITDGRWVFYERCYVIGRVRTISP